ncbi:hypothetical protein [uncultured Litoreibacter sp.]|nr:hypothetical protein [uncultured Litoreibacter sp.]
MKRQMQQGLIWRRIAADPCKAMALGIQLQLLMFRRGSLERDCGHKSGR